MKESLSVPALAIIVFIVLAFLFKISIKLLGIIIMAVVTVLTGILGGIYRFITG